MELQIISRFAFKFSKALTRSLLKDCNVEGDIDIWVKNRLLFLGFYFYKSLQFHQSSST